MPCETGTEIARAAKLLREGKLVAFATETVYGLGAHALDDRAAAGIFAAKERPAFDPLIVHIAERAQLNELVSEVPDLAVKLADAFWPGPLTMVLPKREIVPDLVTSGLPSVAVRIPAHPIARELLRTAGIPVAAPSANLFGQVSPTTAAHVSEQLGDRIDYILDGGPCTVGLESTVVAITREWVTLLRPGGTPVEVIEEVVGKVMIPEPAGPESDETAQHSPGMLTKHYAPRKPLFIVDDLSQASKKWNPAETGVLLLEESPLTEDFASVESLSPAGDLTEAAMNFFAALRRLDKADIARIVATPFPDQGLGRALNDRLRRASVR
ncbi:MAG: threonylcarbamoyl-AMP synthase [Planctomyces sp.]|nr:threonylcarbamoyl-AMP synthase [Planctomyces sp.]